MGIGPKGLFGDGCGLANCWLVWLLSCPDLTEYALADSQLCSTRDPPFSHTELPSVLTPTFELSWQSWRSQRNRQL
eukprot:6191832-Pleurochrysis_carterae.AAC.1